MAKYFVCRSLTTDSNLGKLILDVNSVIGFPTAEQALQSLQSVTQLNPHGWKLVRIAEVSVKVTAQAEPEPETEEK